MSLLKRRLEDEHGFHCVMFSYPSVTGTMLDHVSKLRELAQQQQCARLHFVGHSLGGVVCYNLLTTTNDLPPGRAVLLGSPLQGSRVVEVVGQWALGRMAVGDEVRRELLEGQPRQWDGHRDIGIIAGSSTTGLGRLISTELAVNSDGTVLIEETQLAGAADHIVMPVTHTSMVFSPAVAQQIAKFLREGHFDHSAE